MEYIECPCDFGRWTGDQLDTVLIHNHEAGFFSCSSIRLYKIIQYFNMRKKLPRSLDSSLLYSWYKVNSSNDITFNYFNNYSNYNNIEYNNNIDYHYKYEYANYSTLEYNNIDPFIKKYFSPSEEIQIKIQYLKDKYNLDYKNICVLFYRGNDKNSESNICNHDEYIKYAKKIVKANPNIRFLIQSDETDFIEKMTSLFENTFYFKDEIRHIRKCDSTVDKQSKNNIDVFSKFYLAITIIMSKCKYIVCGSGNCSKWIMLYRNNNENVFQNLNGKWIENSDINEKDTRSVVEQRLNQWNCWNYKPLKEYQSLEWITGTSFQSRHPSLNRLVNDAISEIKTKELIDHPISWAVYSGDTPMPREYCPFNVLDMFNMSDCKINNDKIFPDFMVDKFTETGLNDYEDTIEKIIVKSNQPYISNKLYWIGNYVCNKNRQTLYDIGRKNMDTMDINTTYLFNEINEAVKTNIPFVSLEDHCKYKYLIDVDGAGHSGRTKLLSFSKRLLFVNDRPFWDWAGCQLEHGKHIIMIDNGLTQLEKTLEYLKREDNACTIIAKQAQEYSIEHFRRKNAIDKIVKMLVELYNRVRC